MADRWIITNKEFHQHNSIGVAETELARLSALHPGKNFTIVRIKSSLKRSNAPFIIRELSTALAALLKVHREMETCGVMPADKAIACGRAETVLAKWSPQQKEAA